MSFHLSKVAAGISMALLMLLALPVVGLSLIASFFEEEEVVASQNCAATPGQLPAVVPQPVNSIITEAAALYDTDPIALAVLWHNENGWRFDREPPPPYGNGRPWASSPKGANGPMQFLYGTWRGYKNSNPASQPGDIQDLTDAMFGAAHYLSDLGGTVGTPLGHPSTPKLRPSIMNAIVSYHSGQAFDSLGPAGRQYIEKGYEAYQALQANGGLAGEGSPAPVPSTCMTPVGMVGTPAEAVHVAINAARSAVGTPYVWGGEEPGGFDCSGLMQWSYAQAGVTLPRTAQLQYNEGTKVSLDELLPGDLVFSGTNGSTSAIYHVSMYIGDGQRIAAPFTGEEVRISTFDKTKYVGAIRPIPATSAEGSILLAGDSSGWEAPVRGNFRKSSGYGMRLHPIFRTFKMHNGQDWAAPTGTPVYAVSGGTIKAAGRSGAAGNRVVIDHGGGVTTTSMHLSSYGQGILLNPNGRVVKGQIIGYVGSTGASTGPHLHFEVSVYGRTVDPISFLRGKGLSV